MAEQASQETTLQQVLDQLKVSNELITGHSVKSERIFGEIKKQRSDAGKHHNWNKKDSKADDQDQKDQTKTLGRMASLLLAGKKLAEAAAKRAKVAGGKIKDFAGKQIDGIKKAAGNLLDLLQKGLGLLALWALFKWISTWDIPALIEGAKKVGEILTSLTNGLLGIGAWMGVDRIVKFFTGTSPTGNFIQRIKDAMKNTWLGRMATNIKSFFAVDGKDAKELSKWQKRLVKVKDWFKNSWMNKLVTRIQTFFGQKGSGGKMMAKIGNLFAKIGGLFGKIPGIGKILSFVKGAAKFLGKIFVPVTVIMALWEAVSGFMDGFAETEGNMFQKILGGIGGAIKGLLDFFIFGIAEMIQDVIVWLLELFGFDSAATAVGDFNLVGMIKDAVFAVIDFVTELFSFRDTSLSGIFKSLIDIIMLPLNMAINFIKNLFGWGDPEEPFKFSQFIIDTWNTVVAWVKGLFSWGMAAGETEDGGWSLMKFVNEVWAKVKGWVTGLLSWASEEDSEDSFIVKTVKNAITAAKEWLGKMFKFDSASDILASAFNVLTFLPNLIKDALLSVTEWLLDLFGFGEEAKKVANAKNFSIGDMIVTLLDKLVTWLSELFNFDIKAIIAESLGALGDAGKKVMGWLGFGGDEVDKNAMGGPVGKGAPILVGEHGPELFVPSASGRVLPKMQTENALAGAGGGAPTIINAPTSNVSSGSTTVALPSSSINPMNDKYFRMA